MQTYSLSIFGLNFGDTTTRDIDTLIYIEPLKCDVTAKIHYEYGKLRSVECLLSKTGIDSTFQVLVRYLCRTIGKPFKTEGDSSEKYYIWVAGNCCVDLIESKKDSSTIIRIDDDGKTRLQMLQQMESLYDSISAYRKRK
ncbi:MAG: hypothetical protein JW915_08515 [Chitinispirillaceae bacterium]|nr:hypothetical protein [Chitinispirillaceae bacterium]